MDYLHESSQELIKPVKTFALRFYEDLTPILIVLCISCNSICLVIFNALLMGSRKKVQNIGINIRLEGIKSGNQIQFKDLKSNATVVELQWMWSSFAYVHLSVTCNFLVSFQLKLEMM